MALGQKPNSLPVSAAAAAPAQPGPFVEREKRVVRKLVRLAGERAEAERTADATLRKAQQLAATTRDDAKIAAEAQHAARLEVMDRQYQQTRQSITTRYEELHGALEREAQETLEAEQTAVDSLEKKTQQALHDAVWLARNVYDAARKQAKERLDELQQQIKARVYATQSLQHTCAELLAKLDQHKVIEAANAINHDNQTEASATNGEGDAAAGA